MKKASDKYLTMADAECLERCIATGGVAICPTDTVYGLACDPEDSQAAERLCTLKSREPGKPAAVMFFRLELALETLDWLDQATRDLLAKLLPGPVTAVLPNPDGRFPLACGQAPSALGLRVPDLDARLAALASIELPLMQSSANLAGGPAPSYLATVPKAVREGVDLALDAGELSGVSSTVVDLTLYGASGNYQLLREGGLPAEELHTILS